MENTPDRKKLDKLAKLARLADDIDTGVVEHLFELDEKIEELEHEIEELELQHGEDGKNGEVGEKGEKGEKGDTGELGDQGEKGEKGEKGDTGENGKDGIDGKDGKDGLNGKDGSPDTPDQVIEKVNQSSKQIKLERIETTLLDKKFEEMKTIVLSNVQSLPITTSFINGRRAKNFNIIDATVSYDGDTANITTGVSGVTTIGTIDSQTPSANGAVISGTELVMQSASTTVPGLVSVGNQTWIGTKSVEKTATSVSATDTAIRAETFVNFPASDTVDALVLGSIGYLGITDAQDHLYGTYVGVAGNSEHAGIGTVAQLIGSGGSVTNTGGGTITDAIGVAAFVWNDSGTITNAYGFKTLFLSGTNTYGFFNDIAGSQNRFTKTTVLENLTTGASDYQATRSDLRVNLSGADSAVDILSLEGQVQIDDNINHPNAVYVGLRGAGTHEGSGTVAVMVGSNHEVINFGSGVITTAAAVNAYIENAGGGSIGTSYGFRVSGLAGTTQYGFYNDIAGSVNVFTRTHILAGDAIRFYDTDNSHYTGIAANGTTTASIDYTLPAAGPAGDGYALVSTTTGVMSWVANPGAWSLTGNAGTTAGTNFIGTTDAVDLVFKRNSVEQARFVADQLTLKPSAGTYNITTSADTDTITVGVVGVTTQSQFSTSKDLISMKYIGTVPTMAAGVEASVNGLVFYNGSSGLWLWPSLDSTGTQALVSDGSGVLSWATVGVGSVTSVNASGGTTGLSFSGGPITTSGTLTLAGTLALANGGTGTTTGLPINNLIAATGTNTINNANYAQAWQWNSLTTQTALGLSSSSNTSGALLSLSSTSTAVTTNTGMLNVSYSGTPSTSGQTTYAIYANNNVVGNTGQVRYGVRGGVSGGTLFAGGGTGIGGLFTSSTTGTAGYGVQGTVSGQLISGGYGVYGSSTASSSAGAYGVYGISTGSSLGYGTYGSASNTSGIMYGSYGIATTTLNGGNSYGGRFRAVANTNGNASFSYGVYGEAVTTGNGTAYGGYFSTTEVSTNNIAAYFTATGGTNNYGIIVANGRTGFGITAPTAFVHEVQPVSTTGSPTALLVAGGAHTTLTASTEATDINLNLARTVQFATGALTTQRAMLIQAPTYGFVGASTITDAYTVAIGGAPVAGTNATITRSWALAVQAGNTQLAGSNYLGATGVAPTAFAHIAAGTTAQAQIRLTPGVAPTTPNDGDVYYIDTNDRFMVRKNTLDSEIISASAVTTELVVSDTTLTITYNGVTYKLLAVA